MNRYGSIPVITNPSKPGYYANAKYPQIPYSTNDIYVIPSDGDRFDLLANQYYGDSTLWWIIPIANPHISQNSLYAPLDTQIRIPANPASIVLSYNQLNS